MKKDDKQISVKLASGITILMLATATLSGTVSAYAEGINTNDIVETQYKEGQFITNYESTEDEIFNAYVVKKGDNTSKISEKICKYFGKEISTKYWPVVAYLNNYPRIITPGDIVIFPETYEIMNETLTGLKESNWLSKYVQYQKVYDNNKKQPLTIGRILDDIYGKGTQNDADFVKRYLRVIGYRPSGNKDTQVLDPDQYFELTEWIPTLEELGMEPKTQKRGK